MDYEQHFCGRVEILDVLHKRIKGFKDGFRQNVALVGSRYLGKSVLLRHLAREIDDDKLMVVYLDLEDRDFPYLAQQLARSVLFHFLKKANQPAQDDIDVLCLTARPLIPQTVGLLEAVLGLTKEEKLKEAFHAFLTVTEIFAQETGQQVILIYDEFHCLQDFGIDDVFVDLGKRLMTQKHTLNIFSSSVPHEARDILNEKLSLLFGNFEVLEVGALNFNEGLALIDANLSSVKMGAQLKNFIVDFTGGHPLYINLLCQELIAVSAVFRQQEIYAPVLTQAIENLIFNPWGVINRHFELQVTSLSKGKSNTIVLDILVAIAAGQHKLTDLAQSLKYKQLNLTQRLNQFLQAQMVEKNGNYHHIKDKLLAYWLRFAAVRRLSLMELEPGKVRKQFKEEITKAINDFMVCARKDVATRFSELIHKFDNEAFTLNGRRYKLNRFTEIKPVRLRTAGGKTYEAMMAESSDETWLVILKKDPMWEHELNLLNEQIKLLDPKPDRCVVVALSGLEDNARVRALAQKMWVWEEHDINALMRLFDEPALVR